MDTRTWWQKLEESLTQPVAAPVPLQTDWDGEPTGNLKTPSEPMSTVIEECLR